MHNHHEGPGHRFNNIERLRSSQRLARLEVDRVAELALEGDNIQTVLDIGTGTGVFAEAFSHRSMQVTGIDVNPEMLEVASQYVSDGKFMPAPAENLPFPDESFDLTFMGLVLHETDDVLKALQEAYRVTRLRLVVLEWPYAELDFGPGLDERLQPNQIMQLAGEAGFITRDIYRLKQLVLYRFDKG